MQKPETGTRKERQLKFAEAGILFVLLLGVTVFLGVRFGGEDATETAGTTDEPAVEAVVEPAPASEPAGETVATAEVVESAPESAPAAAPVPEPDPEPVTYAEAEAAFHAGSYDAATDLFVRYVADRPENVWGHYMLGLSAWKAGDLELADEALAEARDRQPEHMKTLVNHARVLLDLERDTDARTAVAAALALDPAHVGARRVQARLHHRAGRLDEAVAAYEEILAGDRDDVWALNNLGLILIEQECFDAALAPLARAADLSELAYVHNNLGIALERGGWYAAAAAAYEDALAVDPDHLRAETSLARVAGRDDAPEAGELDLAALAEGYLVPAVAASDTAAATAALDLAAMIADDEPVATAPADPEPSPTTDDEGNR